MTTQVALRLEDDLVAFLDQQSQIEQRSRASITAAALRDYQRRLVQERDISILKDSGDYPDFDGLADYTFDGID